MKKIEAIIRHFKLEEVKDALNAHGMALDVLSMGMSSDLEAAVHCGSTLLRIGSAIFGGRSYPAATARAA